MPNVILPNLGIELPDVGSDQDTWGDILNNDLTILDTAVQYDVTSKTLSNVDVTLTAAEAASAVINLTGALTANVNVIIPATPVRVYLVTNNTTGAFTVTVKTAAGAGVVVSQANNTIVYSDGTNIKFGASSTGALSVTSLGVSGNASIGGNLTVTGSFSAGTSTLITTGNKIAVFGASSIFSVNPASLGGLDNVTIGASIPAAGSFTDFSASGSFAVNGGSLTTNATTFSLLNTNATTLSIGGAATAISLGAATGTLTVNNATVTLPNATTLNINGANPTLASTATGTLTLFNTGLTTANAFGAATSISLGAATGTITLNNATASVKTLSAVLGSVTTPSLTFTGDTNTGVYSPGADTWAVATGGVEALRVDSAQNIGLGGAGQAGTRLNISANATGSTNSRGFRSAQTIQSDVTTSYFAYSALLNTAATTFTLPELAGYTASQGTIGAGSTVTSQYGFYATSALIGATNNFAFRGAIPSGTGRYNLYMDGTADNFLQGSLGVGAIASNQKILVSGNVDSVAGNVNYSTVQVNPTAQAALTGTVRGVRAGINTQATTFTQATQYLFEAFQGTVGAGSTVTNQFGYYCAPLTGATNNYSFYGGTPSGTGRYNLYMDGTADNYLAGRLGVGGLPNTSTYLRVGGNATGNADVRSYTTEQTAQSDVTTVFRGFLSNPSTQAATFTLANLRYFDTAQGVFGAGSSVTDQVAYYVGANIIGATNNYGFFGNIPAGTGRWNSYQIGTACNLYNGFSYFNNNSFDYAPAPATQDTSATLTAAQVKTTILTSNPATAITLTLPTGTTLETITAGSNVWQTNTSMELTIINTNATNAVTIAANTGATIVGNTTVAASSSGTFRIRKTATNTFVAYRK